MNKKLLIIVIVVLTLTTVLIYNKYNTIKNKDKFTDGKIMDPQEIIKNDGKMTFNYLNDPFYSQNILKKYYIDDDKKINGVKVNYHPYLVPVPNCPSSADLVPLVYSADPSLHCRRNVGNTTTWWRKFDTEAQEIFNKYSIHR